MQLKFIDVLLILFRHKKTFVINFLLFSVVAAIISLLLPFWYTSTARLLPPESQSTGLLGFTSFLKDLPIELPGLGGLTSTPADLHIAIMRSNNVRLNVLKKLHLQEYFGVDNPDDALAMLDSRTDLDKTEEGLIVVSCTERTPELAQKMVSTYLDELDRVNKEVRRTNASYTREFIEKRLTQAENDMQTVAQKVADFQKEYGAIDLENQMKTQIEISAQLRAKLVLVEVQKSVLENYVSKDYGELESLEFQTKELQKQLQNLQEGISPIENDLILSFRKVPDLAKNFIFLKRDLEVQKTIYQFLMQQYEQAKIQEAKDSPTIQVLDRSSLPEKRSRPKRSIIVMTSALASILFSFLVVWVMEFMANLAANEPEKHQRLITQLRSLHKLR